MKLANRFLALFALALLCVGTAQAQNPQVTFEFDASTLIDACQFGPESVNPNSFVSLRGTFNDYAERTHELTDADGDGIYTVTLAVAPGDYAYKFYHSVLGWEDAVTGSTHPDGNRQVTVTADAAQTIPAVPFNKTFNNICGQGRTAVTFQLDASNLVDQCQLGANSADPDAFVSARGNFNSYNERDLVFADEDGDGTYTATVELLPGDYDFKLYHSVLSWENGVPGSTHPDGNRQFSVTGGETLVLPVMTFNKGNIPNVCGATSQCVDVFFRVNMGPQIAAGSFDPAVNLVTVAGLYNGWNTTADTLEAELRDPNIYSKLVTLEDQLVPGEVEYKFVSGTRGESPGGWESFNGNRFLAVTGQEEDFDGNGCIDIEPDPVPFFNNASFADLFSQDALVTLEADLRPAFYFLADSSYVPGSNNNAAIDRLETFSDVFVNGPLAGGWASPWSPSGLGQLAERMLYDDGTHGDAVAGDTIYTWQTTRQAGSERLTTFKFGLDGYDNENASGADHRLAIPDEAAPTVRVIFGAARQSEGEYRAELYEPYIAFDADGTPYVVRRGAVDTGVEQVGAEVPAHVALGQNYPNPFNPSTSFEYTLRQGGHVTVSVFDLTGREVARLVDAAQGAGTYRVAFDGSELASGIYVYRLQAAGQVLTKKMTLVK